MEVAGATDLPVEGGGGCFFFLKKKILSSTAVFFFYVMHLHTDNLIMDFQWSHLAMF